MASDIVLNDNSVSISGKVGIGTDAPTNQLHVIGSGPVTIENPNGESDILFKSGNNPPWQVGTNSTGWYVWDNAYRFVVKSGGNVGIGTTTPVRKLHVEGSEIHSGGADCGFSFDDRKKGNAERWVWYAEDGKAHLWSQKHGVNVLSVFPDVSGVQNSMLTVNTIRATGTGLFGTINGQEFAGLSGLGNHILCIANHLVLSNPKAGSPDINVYNRALTHTVDDQLVINESGGYKKGVKIEGNVQVTGVLNQASSIALKENVTELTGQEAIAALQGLNAVKYNYKADRQKEQHIGFIAEEVPDLVANSERDRLSPMDIVAVLTKAMQEQQNTISKLIEKVESLTLDRH
jgi:hypothetical protein